MTYETIDAPQIDDLMNRRDVRPPAGWEGSNGNSNATTTAQPTQTHVANEPKDKPESESDTPSDKNTH
jgi:cell division protease FtsH